MKRILVIEDNDGVREEIVDILRFEGFEVRDAENGRIGLEVVRSWAPDVVICDLMMPELDGYATLTEVRADPASSAVAFICLTARGEITDTRRAMDIGADGYVTKPFTVDDLIDAVHAALAKRARAAS
jgi:DNA-binding response OmpR family regulator